MVDRSSLAFSLWLLLLLAANGGSAQEPSVKPPDMPPVQRPADPAAVGQQMTDMKAAADALIAEAKAELAKGKTPATELFVRYEGRIHLAMWPAFGPANAWLFNERGGKIRQLAEALGVAGEGQVGFEDYATVILAVLASDADLQPFVDGEGGLDVSEQERTDGGGLQRGWSGPLRAEGLRTDERLGRIRGQLRSAVRDRVLPQLDVEHNRIRVRHGGQTTELVFQWIDRWVLAEIASHP